jgi:integrase-like protein
MQGNAGIVLSTATIWKTLRRHRSHAEPVCYSRAVPGERVQMDTCKIAPGVYPYTAIDDCTRFRVLGIYSRRTSKNSVRFLEERMLDELPFPIQRIQTDRGGDFYGLTFRQAMRRNFIKFRPNWLGALDAAHFALTHACWLVTYPAVGPRRRSGGARHVHCGGSRAFDSHRRRGRPRQGGRGRTPA